jgi:mannose-6-phosphate isomerase
MGTHINGPSSLMNINNQEELVSDYISNKYGEKELPFLLKVLTIKDPLSIQIHPNKEYAEVLNKKDPSNYKDANHKPELAIAISDKFSLIYGFKSTDNAKATLSAMMDKQCFPLDSNIFKLVEVFLKDESNSIELYRDVVVGLIDINSSERDHILQQLREGKPFGDDKRLEYLFNKFGDDKGILFAILMNYFEINYKDAIFIAPNIPHAYIYGDCIECMANSDNVIRVGLTPKYVDEESFKYITMNHFGEMVVDKYEGIGAVESENSVIYRNEQFKDFTLRMVSLTTFSTYQFKNEKNSILFCLEGNVMVSYHNEVYDKSLLNILGPYDTYLLERNVGFDIKGDNAIFFIAN